MNADSKGTGRTHKSSESPDSRAQDHQANTYREEDRATDQLETLTTELWNSDLTKWSIAAAVTLAIGSITWFVRLETAVEPSIDDVVLEAPIPEANAMRFRLGFSDALEASGRDAVIGEMGAIVLSGPDPDGAYIVEILSVHDKPGKSDALLAQLRSDPRIAFAGPAFHKGSHKKTQK